MQKNAKYITIGLGIIGAGLIIRKLYKMINEEKLSSNFDWSEFDSKDGAKMTPEVKANIKELAKNLEVIRSAVGTPLIINSGYRSPAHNKAVGGRSASFHMTGQASDFYSKTVPTKKIHAIIENLIQSGKIKQGGLGLYPTWIHYDIRGTKARW